MKLRFLLDHNVDAECVSTLIDLGHDAWPAYQAGHAQTSDADLAVYAHDQSAVLVTHDKELVSSRRHMPIGRYVLLSCVEWEAPSLLRQTVPDIAEVLSRTPDLIVKLSIQTDGTPRVVFRHGGE